jgi:L-fuculose-phosphate aldolase
VLVAIEKDLRDEIVEIGRRVSDRFFVAANDGNISARLPDGSILVTPTGVSKGTMRARDLILVTPEGKVLDAAPGRRPSSETPMHLAAYRLRADVQAVVHAHPPVATGFSIAGQGLDAPILPEIVLTVGTVPLVPYGTPAGVDLQNVIEPFIPDHDSLLLANHGAVTFGDDLTQAFFRMESLELYARVLLVTRLLGSRHDFDLKEMGALMALRARSGSRGKNTFDPGRPARPE